MELKRVKEEDNQMKFDGFSLCLDEIERIQDDD